MSGTDRPRRGPVLALAALAAAGMLACAAQRPPASEAPRPAPYASRLQLTAEARGRGMSLAAGAAVDPGLGARLELRDPMGATVLLLWVSPAGGRILSPDGRQEARWEGAVEVLPWSPSEVWALLTGALPAGARSVRRTSSGALSGARWDGPYGRVTLRAVAAPGRPFPPESAELSGPGPARLGVRWTSLSDQPPPASALEPPPPGEPVPLSDLVGEILR